MTVTHVPAILQDSFGRVATDLRVSLTTLIRIAVERLGVRQLRFTGGEPLLRPGLAELIARVKALAPAPRMSVTFSALEYLGHPSADRILTRVAHDIVDRHPTIGSLALGHRLGRLNIGETALLCAVSAPHRDAAFRACSDAVETVKRLLPVWKRQQFTDGSYEWVNST